MTKHYVVKSPVLSRRYIQDEIITAEQVGPDLNRLLQIGALSEFNTAKDDTADNVTIETFILSTTMETFAQWLAVITGSRLLSPAFFKADMLWHEFPIGNGKVFVSRAEPKAWETPLGYNRIALHSGYWGVTDISTEELQKYEPVSFRLIAIDEQHIKVQARCGIPVLAAYFEELLAQVAKRWPDTDLTSGTSQYIEQPVRTGAKHRGGRPRNPEDEWAREQVLELGRDRKQVYDEWKQRADKERLSQLDDPWQSFLKMIKTPRKKSEESD